MRKIGKGQYWNGVQWHKCEFLKCGQKLYFCADNISGAADIRLTNVFGVRVHCASNDTDKQALNHFEMNQNFKVE